MMPQPHTSLLGIFIAIAFVAAMASVLYWMFRVPKPVAAGVAKVRRSLDTARLVLVPATGSPHSQHAVEVACRLAEEQSAAIALLYVVEVPRTVPLDAPMELAEAEAEKVFQTARGVVALHNLPVRQIIHRARDAGNGIIAAAKHNRADLIVVGIGPHPHVGPGLGSVLEALLDRAPCEVIFDKLPE